MTVETTTEATAFAVVKFDIAEATIAKMVEAHADLKINGLDDRDGYVKVHEARMLFKNTRIAIEKKRVDLKEESIQYGRRVDSEAKRLTALLTPSEERLAKEEMAVDSEKARIKAEAEAAKKRKLDERMAKIMAVGATALPSEVEGMTDMDFEARLLAATEAFRAAQERKRLEDEATAKRLAEEAAAQREVAAKARAEQETEAKRLAEARRVLEAEQLAQRQAEVALQQEKAALEAAQKAAEPTRRTIVIQPPANTDNELVNRFANEIADLPRPILMDKTKQRKIDALIEEFVFTTLYDLAK